MTVIAPGCENWPRPQVGDIDTVLRQKTINGELYISLERFGARNGFIAKHFAILPSPSADDMAEADHEAIINLETV